MNNITSNDFKILINKLKILKFKNIPNIIEEIKRTREMGDLSENAEYQTSREIKSILENKIEKLEVFLLNSKIVNNNEILEKYFKIIIIKNLKNNRLNIIKLTKLEKFELKNIIYIKSPLGIILSKCNIGEILSFKKFKKFLKFKIILIKTI